MSNHDWPVNQVAFAEIDRPWRNESILRLLYCEQENSLRETADRLGCSPETVRQWLHRYSIETRTANHEKVQPCYEVNRQGYGYVKVDDGNGEDRVGIHELVAIANGADPYEVFCSGTHCHHRLRVPSKFEGVMQLDIPHNIEVHDAYDHLSRHQTGDFQDPDPEEILLNSHNSSERPPQSSD